jgi:hypothetical protein
MPDSSQWIRRWALYIADLSSGNGISIADGTDQPGKETLHIRFEVHQAAAGGLPGTATIRIWKPPQDVVGKIKQYIRVVLNAGYRDGKFGKIFDGWITYYRYGHETPVDSYIDLFCTDGDMGVTFGTVNKTLMPGANSAAEQTQTVVDAMNSAGGVAPPDSLPQGGPIQPRPTVQWGAASDEMENIRKDNGWLWSVQNGKLVITDSNIANPGEGVVLNATSGLIGWPSVVPDGIEARCLLNPGIFIKERVKLDNASINGVAGTGSDPLQATYPSPKSGPMLFAPTSTDGTYVAFVVEHHGDARGNDWYTDLVLWAIDSATGATLTQDGQVPTDATVDKMADAAVAVVNDPGIQQP